jgi:hypothetical protein
MYKIKRLANKRYFLINLEFGFNQTITIKGIEYKYTLEQWANQFSSKEGLCFDIWARYGTNNINELDTIN